MNVDITTTAPPSDYCPSSFREAWLFGVSLLQATLAGGNNTYVVSATVPGVDDQDKLWHKLDAQGRYIRTYNYSGGAWVSPHPEFAGAVKLWEGNAGDIPTLDGGEAGTVTATTGPMWERVTEMDGRMPIGPGTLESGTTVNVNDTGGEEKHSLTTAEMPPHTHEFRVNTNDDSGGGGGGSTPDDSDPTVSGNVNSTTASSGGTDGTVVAHNNMPPYRGIFFLRKTARTHYRN